MRTEENWGMELGAISAIVLDALADDYEEIEQISVDVLRMVGKRNVPVMAIPVQAEHDSGVKANRIPG